MGRQVGDSGSTDCEAALKVKDARIVELSVKVAGAAKTAEVTQTLNDEIASLKRQMEDERVELACVWRPQSVKTVRALLDEHNDDMATLAEAAP